MEQIMQDLGTDFSQATKVGPGVYSFKPQKKRGAPDDDSAGDGAATTSVPGCLPGIEAWNLDMDLLPDLSAVHRAMIPGIWNRIRMNTFPESWAVLDFAEGSLTRAQLRSYGEGGLSNVVRYLRPDAVQFCGFRVALSGDQAAAQPASAEEGSDWQKPFSTGKSVFVCWIGENVSEEQRRTAIMQLPFFRDYFYDAAVELLVESPPDVELEGQEIRAMLAQLVVSELRTQAEEAGAPMPTVDFANSDAPDRCIHYDWDLPAPGAEVDSDDEDGANGSTRDHDGRGDMSVSDFARALMELQEAYADTDETDAAAVEARDSVLETAAAGMGLKDHPLYTDFKKGFLLPPARADADAATGTPDHPTPDAATAAAAAAAAGPTEQESAAAALRRKVSGPSKEELAWAAAERSRLRQRIDLLEIEKLRLHHESEMTEVETKILVDATAKSERLQQRLAARRAAKQPEQPET